jgi:hypothetical protein
MHGHVTTIQQRLWISTLLCFVIAALCIVIGHSGNHSLSWVENHISTYAARAPYDECITASMTLIATSLALLGLLLSYSVDFLAHVASLLLGGSAAGMMLILWFEETLLWSDRREGLSVAVLQQQAFHDAGVLLFFSCALLALASGGLNLLLWSDGRSRQLGGLTVMLAAPATAVGVRAPDLLLCLPSETLALLPALLRSAVEALGQCRGNSMALRQRCSFACLALGVVLMTILYRPPRASTGTRQGTQKRE